MGVVIPVVVTFFAVFFITCSASSRCSLSNVESLSDLIDARINATVAAKLKEFTATPEFDTAIEEKVVATVTTTVNPLNDTVNEGKKSVNSTLSVINETIAKLSNRPGIYYYNNKGMHCVIIYKMIVFVTCTCRITGGVH